VASFGERLKKEREKQRISLDDVSLSTKIGTRLLQALEEEKFDQLPGGIFNKGFVRAYARHLGLDENKAVADYLEAAGQAPPPDPLAHVQAPGKPPVKPASGGASPPKSGEPSAKSVRKLERVAESHPLPVFTDVVARKEEKQPVAFPWGMLAILLFVIALIFAAWSSFTRERQPAPGGSHVAPQSLSSPMEASSGPGQNPSALKRTSASAGASAPSLPGSSGNTAPVTSGSFVLLIRAKDDSWLTVTADGNKVFDDTLTAASEKSIPAQKEIVIKAGNIGGLEFSFNGSKLPRQGGDGEVKTLTFGAQGVQAPAPKPPS
jgi:cytoskeleton protein RodZ